MRSGAEVHKLSLLVETDLSVFRKVFDKLYFVGFVFLFEVFNRLSSRLCKSCDGKIFFDDLFHFRLDLCKILSGDGFFAVNIVIETVVDRRSDGELHIRIKTFDRLSHDMRCGMTEGASASLTVKSKDIQFTVPVQHGTEIHNLSVHFSRAGNPRQAFADIGCNINDGFRFRIFLLRSVF